MTLLRAAKSNKVNFPLWFVGIAASFGGFVFGYDVIVMSGAVPVVADQFLFSPFQLGLFVSCVLWGCAVGSALAGWLLDGLGRRKSLILAASILLLSALGSAFAPGPIFLILLRFIGGLGCGLATVVCPLLVSELAPEAKRGRLVSLYHLCVCFGIVVAVFANWGIHSYARLAPGRSVSSYLWEWFAVEQYWRAMFFAEALPGLFFFFLSFALPESPRWLMKMNQFHEAKNIIRRINGKARTDDILYAIKEDLAMNKGLSYKDLFAREWSKPLALGVALCVLSEACGISAVLYYGPQMFEQAGLTLKRSLGGFTILALVNFLFNFVSLGLMDRMGRRKLLLTGASGALLSLLAIGTLFLLDRGGVLLLIPFITFMAFFAFSVGPIKFILISEFFPNVLRSKAASLATLCIWFTSAVVAYLFPVLREIINTGFVFYLFALDLLLLVILTYFAVPETRGRTMEDISSQWSRTNEEIKEPQS